MNQGTGHRSVQAKQNRFKKQKTGRKLTKNRQQHGSTVSTEEHLDTETEEVWLEKAKKDRILLHPLTMTVITLSGEETVETWEITLYSDTAQ